jgi:hypothetical protein
VGIPKDHHIIYVVGLVKNRDDQETHWPVILKVESNDCPHKRGPLCMVDLEPKGPCMIGTCPYYDYNERR